MKTIKWWDEYEIKARYIPTFLSSIPIVHFLILFMGNVFWQELTNSIEWMLVIANLSLSLIVVLALVQLQCNVAKYWIENSIFGNGGEFFPTTKMLLFNGGLVSGARKELFHSKIQSLFSIRLATKNEENSNPSDARFLAREAVGQIRRNVGIDPITYQYNIRYGFLRNLIGGAIWSISGSIGCSIIYGLENSWNAMSLFIIFSLIHLTLVILKKPILERLAFSYADSLFNAFLDKNLGD